MEAKVLCINVVLVSLAHFVHFQTFCRISVRMNPSAVFIDSTAPVRRLHTLSIGINIVFSGALNDAFEKFFFQSGSITQNCT